MKFRIKLIFCLSTVLFCMHENDISLQLPDHQIESNSDKKTEVRIVMSNGVLSNISLSSVSMCLPQVGRSLHGYPIESSIREELKKLLFPVDQNTRFVLKSIQPLAVVCMNIKPINIMEPLECEVWCLPNPNLYTRKQLKEFPQNFVCVDNPDLERYGKALSNTFFLTELVMPGLIQNQRLHVSDPLIRQRLFNPKSTLPSRVEPITIEAINHHYPTSLENIEAFVSEVLKRFIINLADKTHINRFLSKQDEPTIDAVLKMLIQGAPFIIPDNEDQEIYQEILLGFIKEVWRNSLESLGVKTKNKTGESRRYTTYIYVAKE